MFLEQSTHAPFDQVMTDVTPAVMYTYHDLESNWKGPTPPTLDEIKALEYIIRIIIFRIKFSNSLFITDLSRFSH